MKQLVHGYPDYQKKSKMCIRSVLHGTNSEDLFKAAGQSVEDSTSSHPGVLSTTSS